MSFRRTYRIFISHAWDYSEEYHRFVNLLDNAPYFSWENYSVPEHDPLHTRIRKETESGLQNHIRPVNIVVILSGMYTAYSDWMQVEIGMAVKLDKPIIGVMPWGIQRTPTAVQEVALEMVGWNTDSIINAIRKYAR